MPIERDAVVWGYRLLLGREPESEKVIQAHQQHEDIDTLRVAFISSPEFRQYIEPLLQNSVADPFTEYGRDCVVFLHIPKTAGTTLHELLAQHFQLPRICPERFNMLHVYSPAALSGYDFYSGHLGLVSLVHIPRARKKIVSLFRKPRERLLSIYYFLRIHLPDAGDGWSNRLVTLANTHTLEEFFWLPEVRLSTSVWNTYALSFGGHLFCGRWENAAARANVGFADSDALLSRAIDNIRSLAALGVVEHMDESIDLIFRTLNLPVPKVIPRRQVTKLLHEENPKLRKVEKMPVTDSLNRSLDDLVCLDEQIYSEVLCLFESRCHARGVAG